MMHESQVPSHVIWGEPEPTSEEGTSSSLHGGPQLEPAESFYKYLQQVEQQRRCAGNDANKTLNKRESNSRMGISLEGSPLHPDSHSIRRVLDVGILSSSAATSRTGPSSRGFSSSSESNRVPHAVRDQGFLGSSDDEGTSVFDVGMVFGKALDEKRRAKVGVSGSQKSSTPLGSRRGSESVSAEEPPQASEFWSKGSADHDKGTCRPCHYVHTLAGCRSGSDCSFCHIPHEKKGQGVRPCKSKRQHYQRYLALIKASGSTSEADQGQTTTDTSGEADKLKTRPLVSL
mmetsp:Transcript_14813/g.31984  ORF Transcript_14813/g.31984 Transcript_14813/m.31984 type:complete len:288 (-) Transcript_14813:170-1033(-)